MAVFNDKMWVKSITKLTFILALCGISTACEERMNGADENSTEAEREEQETSDVEERCEEYADMVYNECIAGGSEEECEERATTAYDDCVANSDADDERGDDEDREDGDTEAEARCKAYAEMVYGECIDAGGSEEECGERTRVAFEDCLADAESDGEREDDEREDDEREE